jgi:hypothetical protein
LVNKDFGDFLVILYICIYTPPLHPAYPLSKSRVFFTNQLRQPKNLVRGYPKINLSFFWLPLGIFSGGLDFCT